MSTVQKIARNTGLLVFANVVNLAMGLVINILIAQTVSVGDFGMVNWALNLATIFTLVTDLGVSTYLAIELPRYPERLKTYLGNALSLKLALNLVAMAGIALTALAGGLSATGLWVLLFIAVYVAIQAISQVLQAIFQAFQSMEHLSVSQIMNGVILATGAAAVVTLKLGIVAFAAVYTVAALCILLYTAAICARYYARPWPAFDPGVWRQIVSKGWPLSISAILSFLYFKIDIQLIDVMMGRAQVGYYSAAFKLIEAVIVLPALYGSVIFPLVSVYYHKNDPYLGLLLKKSVKYLYVLGAPISLGTILLADKFIYTLYPVAYAPSIDVLRLLGVGIALIFITSVPAFFLAVTGMQRANVKANVALTAVNVALNLILIPAFGLPGAALAMVATQVLSAAFSYVLVKRLGYGFPGLGEAFRITACTAAMGVFVYFAHDYNLAVIVAAAAAIYAALILLSRALSAEDLELLSNIYRKKG